MATYSRTPDGRRPRRYLDRTSPRGGFTLVELLVVITIIGMLMALLLPAVNAAVESARNLQCKNNLAELAKATNSYEKQWKSFPGYENQLTDNFVGSWVAAILPQIDRLDLAELWKDESLTSLPPEATPRMELLVCPSDPPEDNGGPVLSYVVNSGYANQDYSSPTVVNNGICHTVNLRTNSDNLKDGVAYTLLMTENIQARRAYVASSNAGGWGGWSGGHRNRTTFMWFNSPFPTNSKINENKITAPSDTPETARPSSFHSAGVNVAFADTHVIFLKDKTAPQVLRQLMTPYHRESDAEDKLTNILDEKDFK